jgi:hypothetical protein
MAVVPSGLPAWARTASFTEYGGHLDKRDYGGVGAINPYTDLSAAQFSRMVSDVAATVRTAPFAVITYLCNDTSPAAPTIEVVYMMTGVRLTSYAGDAAPAGFPSAARNGAGDVTFTFSSSYSDEYAVSQSFALRHSTGNVHATSGVYRTVMAEVVTSTTLRVRVRDNSGAISDPRVTVVVY